MPLAFAETGPDPEPQPEVNVVAASIDPMTKTLAPGDAPFTISILKYFPANTNEPLTWITSNRGVATIDIEKTEECNPSVTVTPIKNGRETISLVGSRSGITLASCQVTVRTVKITSFSISPKSLTLAPAPARPYTLTANVKPSSATCRSVTWTSSDPEVLSFSPGIALGTVPDGARSVQVYARTEGRVTIIAVTDTGKRTARVVNVRNLPVTSVKFPRSKATIYLEAYTPTTLTALVSPSTASEEALAVTYTSSDENILTLTPLTDSPNTVELVPHTTGRVTITATAGGRTGRCTVTVDSKAIKSLSIATPDGAPVVLAPGDSSQLKPVVNPSYASNRSVKWSSDNKAVADVDENGLVTAVAGGITNIRCESAANPKISAALTVHVLGDSAYYRTVTVTAAGDAVLGGDPRKGSGVRNPRSYQAFKTAVAALGGDDKVFANVQSYFSGDDNVSSLNLEGTLTYKNTLHMTKPFVFQGDPPFAKTMLRASGISAVSLANNHSYDVGQEGYDGTKRALKNAGVESYGNGSIGYVTKNNVRVAFVSAVSKKILMSRLRSQIQTAAKKADVVVVRFHWTDSSEFKYAMPTRRQQSLARTAISYGADLVVGEHSHRLKGIERYKGKYIVYDLGNFVTLASNPVNKFSPSNPSGKYDYDSMIYQQKFNIWSDGFVQPAEIKIIPCAITSSYATLVNNAQPTPYTLVGDINRVMETIRTYSPVSGEEFDKYPINQ